LIAIRNVINMTVLLTESFLRSFVDKEGKSRIYNKENK